MSSRRQVLINTIKTCLEKIVGTPDYTYNVPAAQIQLYKHTWDENEETVNTFATLPAIMVKALTETSSMETIQQWVNRLTVDLGFYLGSEADEDDISAALADMKKALFVSNELVLAGAYNISMESSAVDPETARSLDGVHTVLTLEYMDTFGDPATGD